MRGFFIMVVLAQDTDEEDSEEESDKGATDDFVDPMSDALLEAGKLVFGNIQLLDEHIQVPTLITEVHADTGRVIDDDEGEDGRERKGTGVDAFVVGDTGQERDHERGVSTRHVTVSKGVLDVKPVLVRVERKLDELGDDTDGDRNQEDQIGLQIFHRNI